MTPNLAPNSILAMLRFAVVAGSALALAAFSGCATRNITSPIAQPLGSGGYTNTSGSPQFFDEDSFEKIDLPSLLDPERRRDLAPLTAIPPAEDLDKAFAAFYRYPSFDLQQRRNRVQDRVLAASEQRCNVYKNYLRRVETFQGTATGILATIFGGAGAIASGASSARALSGLAGVSSGIGAELKQGYFSNIATQIIVPGIDLARAEIQRDILSKRDRDVTSYTVEAALQDAARYHGACSLNAGLDRAGMAVTEVKNPGISAFNRTIGQLNLSSKLVRRINDDTVKITDEDTRLATDLPTAYASVGVAKAPATASYTDRYIAIVSDAVAQFTSLKNAIEVQKMRNIVAVKEADKKQIDDSTFNGKGACQQLKEKQAYCEAYFDLRNLSASTIEDARSAIAKRLDDAEVMKLAPLDTAIRQKQVKLTEASSDSDRTTAQSALQLERADQDLQFLRFTSVFPTLSDQINRARANLSQNKIKPELEKNLERIIELLNPADSSSPRR